MFKDLILASSFRDKINCMLPVLENAGIKDYQTLQNAPSILGNFCDVDIYQFVAELNILYEVAVAVNQEDKEEE